MYDIMPQFRGKYCQAKLTRFHVFGCNLKICKQNIFIVWLRWKLSIILIIPNNDINKKNHKKLPKMGKYSLFLAHLQGKQTLNSKVTLKIKRQSKCFEKTKLFGKMSMIINNYIMTIHCPFLGEKEVLDLLLGIFLWCIRLFFLIKLWCIRLSLR